MRDATRAYRVASRLRAVLPADYPLPTQPPSEIAEDLRQAASLTSSVLEESDWQGALARIDEAWPAGFLDGARPGSATLPAVLARCEEVLGAPERAHEWIVLQHTLRRCHELGLGRFVDSLGSTSARAARGAFERRFYIAWVNAVLGTESALVVDQQVGASEYRIDLAVRDHRDPSRYLLGIECDGATYHSARTARDRDILRASVLRDLGWRLHRIWSTDWFRNREKAIEGALRAVERAMQAPAEHSVAGPPRDTPVDSPPPRPPDRRGQASGPASTSRRYPVGLPYRKHRGQGRRELLLRAEHAHPREPDRRHRPG